MNFFTKVILGSVAVLLAAVAVVLIFRSREAGRVEALIREAAGWAAAGEADRVSVLIDDDFEAGGADMVRAEIRRRIKPGAFKKLEINKIDVGVEGDEARVRVVVLVLPRDAPIDIGYPEVFHITLRRREAGWRVVDAEQGEPRLRR